MDKEMLNNVKKHIDNAEISLYNVLKVNLYEVFDHCNDVIEIPANNNAQAVASLTSVARILDNIRLEIMLQEDEQEED